MTLPSVLTLLLYDGFFTDPLVSTFYRTGLPEDVAPSQGDGDLHSGLGAGTACHVPSSKSSELVTFLMLSPRCWISGPATILAMATPFMNPELNNHGMT